MTAIDLTRDQCAALANFLRRTVDRIMGSAFQPWEVRYPEKVFGGK